MKAAWVNLKTDHKLFIATLKQQTKDVKLTKKTCIQWFGGKTDIVRKTRAVTQGYPLSPIIFTIALTQS